MNRNLTNKILSFISAASLLLNTFAAPAVVLAQEATQSAETEATPTPTPTVTASPSPTPSPEPTLEASPSTTPETQEGEVEALSDESTTQTNSESKLPEPDLSNTQEDGSAQLDPSVTTDKEDYAPTETVTISGEDFTPNTNLEIRVTWPDDIVRNSDGDEGQTDTVLTDDSGDFIFFYDLRGEGQEGEYLVEILLGSTVFATTSFTDAHDSPRGNDFSIDFAAAKPGTYDKSTGGGKYGIGSNVDVVESLNGGDFVEGDIVSFFDAVTVQAGAYDTGEATLNIVNKFGNESTNNHPAGFNKVHNITINPSPPETGHSKDGDESITLNSNNNTITGGDLIADFNLSGVDPGETIIIRIDVVIYSDISGNVNNATVQTRLDSASIVGCSNQCSVGGGDQTIPLKNAEEIVQGDIIIRKETIPTDDTTTDFSFTGELGEFTLTGNGDSSTFGSLSPDSYDVTESPSFGWELTNIVCEGDQDGESVIDLSNNTVSVDLDDGESIECTFTNDLQQGSITVLKNVDEDNDGEINEFGATDWTWDIQDGEQNISTGDSKTLVADGYTVTEDIKEGYHIVGWQCESDQSGVTSGTDNLINITLNDGENITCTFTNAADTGDITLIKSSENDIEPNNWTFDVDGPGDNDFTDVKSGEILEPLPLGTYTITENGPENYHFVLGSGEGCEFDGEGVLTVEIVENGDTFECTFTNAPDNGSISGNKYHDKDASSSFNSEIDELLSDWTIFLDDNSNGELDTGETSTSTVDGSYTFPDLVPGDYEVCEVLKDGWTQVSPDPNTNNGCHSVTVDPGQGVLNIDFFNFKNITISGFKFKDVNGDGIWDLDGEDNVLGNDDDEAPLNDWTINLGVDATDSVITGDDTNGWPDGYYEFSDLGPGDYEVSEDLTSKPDWLQTAGDNPYTITSVGGQDVEDTNFGNFKFAKVWGFKYNDLDADGDITDDIEKLDGWEINLTGEDSVTTGFDTWEAGYYEFDGLIAGNYILSETLDPGWTQSYPESGTYEFAIRSGDVLRFDFANWTQGELVACKYDENENGVLGWEMTVTGGELDESGVSKDTGGNGCATFDLDPGNYTVTEEDKDDWVHVDPKDGDLEATVESNKTTTVNFFNERKGSLTIIKFNDEDGDSVDDDEPRLEGWHFSVYEGSCADEGDLVLADETDSNGEITELLESGNYCAVEDDTSHDGWTNTTDLEVDFSLSTDGSETIKFGNQGRGTISGFKFNDENNNGQFDEGEPKLENWTIFLDENENEELDGGEDSTTTDVNGEYSFDVAAGTYSVCEEVQEDWEQTLPGTAEDPSCYSVEVDPGEGETGYNFGNFLPNPSLANVKSRQTEASEILEGDTVTYEIEVENTGNVTLYNPTVVDIYDTDYVDFDSSSPISPSFHFEGDGDADESFITVPDTGDYDSDGDTSELLGLLVWEIPTSLDPGETYTITITFLATNFTPEPDVLATNGAATTACLHEVGVEDSCEESVDTETSFASVDIDALGAITGLKFDDENGDSERDEGEGTVSGVTIRLFEYDEGLGSEVDSTTTDSNGEYSFEDVSAGTYAVCEDVPTDSAQTFPLFGDDVVSTENGFCYLIEITEDGGEFDERDFGNLIVILGLSIEKSNDSPTTTAGSTVTYTLTVENTGNVTINNVDVIDVLPGGFTYITGSTDGDTTSDPTITDGQLKWDNVADLDPGDTITITYEATISGDADEATYTNIATCEGTAFGGFEEEQEFISFLRFIEREEETVECNVANSDVTLTTGLTLSADIEGEVLGAATELPAAGNDTMLLYIFLGMIVGGFSLRIIAKDLEKKENKNA